LPLGALPQASLLPPSFVSTVPVSPSCSVRSSVFASACRTKP